jgi:hypothetical protein
MSNHIDQLFKNKLGDLNLPPSEEAWAKVEAGLSKRNKVIIYWRAAAVFVLLGLLISAWYLFTGSIVSKQEQLTLSGLQKPTPEIIKESIEPNKAQTLAPALDTPKKITTKKQSKKYNNTQDIDKPTVTETTTELAQNLSLNSEMLELNESIASVNEVKQEKAIVIEFELPAIAQTNSLDVVSVSTEPEKSNGIMKLLETARDVKNGDAELGNSLRDIKNELLAFDFKKDKTKRN